MIVPPDDFLPRVKAITETNGVPPIVDEVQTGFGRTGKWFASEWSGVTPDVVTMGKALGGIGLPLSGILFSEDLDTWDPGAHTGTFRGDLAAMRAGLRAIEYVEAHDLLKHTRELGGFLRSRLEEIAAGTPLIGDVRGRGLLIGAEFVGPDIDPGDAVSAVRKHCYERGVLTWKAGRDGEVLRPLPPLVMTHEQAERRLDVIEGAIREVSRSSG